MGQWDKDMELKMEEILVCLNGGMLALNMVALVDLLNKELVVLMNLEV